MSWASFLLRVLIEINSICYFRFLWNRMKAKMEKKKVLFPFQISAHCRTGKELLNFPFLLGSEISNFSISLPICFKILRLEPRNFFKLVLENPAFWEWSNSATHKVFIAFHISRRKITFQIIGELLVCKTPLPAKDTQPVKLQILNHFDFFKKFYVKRI